MTALPEYRYGKVQGLYPDLTVVSERSESPMVCCGWCSAQMACITARTGVSALMTNEAHQMRARSGRPHDAGSKPTELRNGASSVLSVTLKSVAAADMPDRLAKGFAIVASVQYGAVADYLRVQGNDFGHSVTLFGWDDLEQRAGWYDPLWDQGARGAWAPWSDVTPALWADGNHSTTTARLVPVAGDFAIWDDLTDSRRTGMLAASSPFFNDWTMTSRRGAVGGSAIKVRMFGYRGDAYAVQVNTKQGWSDGVERVTMVFVDKTRISGIVDSADPVTPTDPATEAELLAAKQAGYDLALSAFPPRPS